MMKQEPTVQELLMKQTKDQMIEVAIRLQLDMLKSSAKKADWAAHIEKGLHEMPLILMMQLSIHDAEALWVAYRPDGFDVAEDDVYLNQALEPLMQAGVAWMEGNRAFVRPWLMEMFPPDEPSRDFIQACDFAAVIMSGMLVHVGMMPLELLTDRAARAFADMDTKPVAPPEQMAEFCREVYIARFGWKCMYIDEDEEVWFLNPALEDPEQLYNRLQEPHLAKRAYPEFPTNTLYVSGKQGYPVIDAKQYSRLAGWIGVRKMDSRLIEDVLYRTILALQNQDPQQAIDFFVAQFQLKYGQELKDALNMLQDLMNSIPHWANKGYSPFQLASERRKGKLSMQPVMEQQQMPMKLPPMPGRNDPCTCGSGKKYKNCCGRRVN